MLKHSLDTWYDGAVNLQGADLPYCQRKARSIHAFRKPSPLALPDISLRIPTVIGSMHHLIGDNLIWLASDQRQIHVLNLRHLISRAMVCDTRERIGTIFAADELVAFTAENKGTVFVGELYGQGLIRKFRFMNAGQKFALTCRRRTVACATLQQDHTFVYIWNFDTEQGKSFHVDRNALPVPMNLDEPGLLLQPDTETILLFQFPSTMSHNRGELICHTDAVCWQFTYTGKCLHSFKQELDNHNDIDSLDGRIWKATRFIPASHDGLFMVHRDLWSHGYRTGVIHKFEFDEKSHTFRSPSHPRLEDTSYDSSGIVWWKDTFIGTQTEDSIIAHFGTTADPFLEPRTASDPKEFWRAASRDRPNNLKNVCINSKWVVRSYGPDTIYVFCYDHTMQLPTTEGTLNGIGDWEVFQPVFEKCE